MGRDYSHHSFYVVCGKWKKTSFLQSITLATDCSLSSLHDASWVALCFPALRGTQESLPRFGALVPRVQRSQEPLAAISPLDLAFFLGLHQRVG